jgi:hypothetical protein
VRKKLSHGPIRPVTGSHCSRVLLPQPAATPTASSTSSGWRLPRRPPSHPSPPPDPALPNSNASRAPAAGHRPTGHLTLPGRWHSRATSPAAAGRSAAAAARPPAHPPPSFLGPRDNGAPRNPDPNPQNPNPKCRHHHHHPRTAATSPPAVPPTVFPVLFSSNWSSHPATPNPNLSPPRPQPRPPAAPPHHPPLLGFPLAQERRTRISGGVNRRRQLRDGERRKKLI